MTRQWAAAGIALAFAALLESSVLPHLTVRGVKPDLVLAFSVSTALAFGPRQGAILGLAGGLLQDVLLGRYLGSQALSKFIAVYLVGAIGSKVYRRGPIVPVAGAALATLISGLFLFPAWGGLAVWGAYTRATLFSAGFNALVCPLLYGWVARFRARSSLNSSI